MKKKILFVNNHLNEGGIEKSLTDLLCSINYKTYDIDLLIFSKDGVYLQRIPKEVNVIIYDTSHLYGPFFKVQLSNLTHLRFNDFFFRLLFFSRLFRKTTYKLIRPLLKIRSQYDYAIAYRVGFPNEIVSLSVNSKYKICWWHNGEYNHTAYNTSEINELWRNMNQLVAVSNGTKQLIANHFKFDYNKISVIPNIIDTETILSLAGTNNPYPNSRTINIVTMGRLCWEKHIEDVPILAKKLIEGGFSQFQWYIIGDGVMRKNIESAIQATKTHNHVIMLGRQSNPYPYIKYAHFMVHTSYVEAHCLTILEAMALETPCVATRTNIPQDFTIDGENCILAKQDIDDQYACILKMIENIKDTETMVENAYQMVRREYSRSIITQKFDNLLASISNNGSFKS